MRRRWKLKTQRERLTPAALMYLQRGMGALLALPARERPDGWREALYFQHDANRRAAWREYGEEICAAWATESAGTRPWGWWAFSATAPRACVEGAEYVYRGGDWIWKDNFGIPNHPQVRRPGEEPARMLFEREAVYLQRLNLLAPGEAEQLAPEAFEPEIVEIPELAELALLSARPTPHPAPALASSTNGAH